MKQDNQDNSPDPTKVTVGCLFAAIGGFVKAFKQKGATILWANETDRWGIRKLTPRECARLQGYEDSWFQIPSSLSNTQVYKQLGNSVTIPLVARLAKGVVQHIRSMNGKGEA